MSALNWFAPVLVAGGLTYLYANKPELKQVVDRAIFKVGNSVVDQVLDWKYQYSSPPPSAIDVPYHLDRLAIIPRLGHIIDLPLNFPQKTLTLDHKLLTSVSNTITYVCLFYTYGENQYLLSLPWSETNPSPLMKLINFPLYDTSDLETSLVMEYEQVATDTGIIDPNVSRMLAGVKGNFHTDLGLPICPRNLLDPVTCLPLVTPQGYLQLTDMLGQVYQFGYDDPIVF